MSRRRSPTSSVSRARSSRYWAAAPLCGCCLERASSTSSGSWSIRSSWAEGSASSRTEVVGRRWSSWTRRRLARGRLPRLPARKELDRMSNDATNGCAEVNGLNMYYERHGDGPPLVLLHGAFGTIESCFAGLLPELACYGRQEDPHDNGP